MKIGIIGGTFNPIHIGHLILAQEAMDQAKLDEIWFVPTGMSYMKSQMHVASAQDRFQMTQLAIADNDKMRCLDIEVKREGYTYTYETLEQLKVAYPKYEFFFIFGADCLYSVENWKNPERIFEQCTVIAAARNGSPLEEMQDKIAELNLKFQTNILLLPFMNLEISSTLVRDKIAKGESVKYLLPNPVISYIHEHALYQSKKE